MNKSTEFENIAFDLPKHRSNVIKVIGVGGGGSNAINHMFQAGINGVDFVVCNTDAQALQNSPVPNKVQLGVSLTEGLGAGANPEVGEQAAIESMEDLKILLERTTKMVFITAGMGGGTGTGAAPVIAKLAKELDILTVGIVTIPFQFEGALRNKQAQVGIEKLRTNVDSLIVINNNKLREVYGNLGFKAGFSKADEVLSTAAKGIAEVITHHYTQNIDLRDAKTVLSNSGTAIMGSSTASGATRAQEAITQALDSPLLNDNKIKGAQNVLLLIVSGTQEITIDEIGEINDHIQIEAGHGANIIMGIGEDESLGDAVAVTIIATGFHADQQNTMVNTETKKVFYTLEDEQTAEQELAPETTAVRDIAFEKAPVTLDPPVIKHTLELEEEIHATTDETIRIPTTEYLRNLEVVYEEITPKPSEDDFSIIDAQSAVPDVTIETGVKEQEARAQTYVLEGKNQEARNLTSNPKPTCLPRPSVCDAKGVEIQNPKPETFNQVSSDTLNAIEVIDPEIVTPQSADDQFTLHFDMPLRKAEEEQQPSASSDLEIDVKAIEVKEYVEIKPESAAQSNPETRYNLEEYMELETHLTEAKSDPDPDTPILKVAETDIEYTPQSPSPQNPPEADENNSASQDPFDSPISDLLRERAEERRRTLKDFNYKFQNPNSSIDVIEKQPAYKRQGIDLEDVSAAQKRSRTTLSEDSNDEMQLRSNNSFLHDNVD